MANLLFAGAIPEESLPQAYADKFLPHLSDTDHGGRLQGRAASRSATWRSRSMRSVRPSWSWAVMPSLLRFEGPALLSMYALDRARSGVLRRAPQGPRERPCGPLGGLHCGFEALHGRDGEGEVACKSIRTWPLPWRSPLRGDPFRKEPGNPQRGTA
jgi:hypothetical protein